MSASTASRKNLQIAGILLVGILGTYLLFQAVSQPAEVSGETSSGVADTGQGSSSPSEASSSKSTGTDEMGGSEPYAGSEKVAKILGDALIEDQAVRDKLLEIASDSSAVVEEREEALSHALMLTPDEDIDLLSETVSEGSWPNELLQVFLDDFMNRPDPGRLTLLVDVMVVAKPPLQNEAKDSLEFLLEQDLGSDIEAWRDAVGSWSGDDSR